MAEAKKLAKRLRTFKEFDEATIVAAITTTGIDLETANEGMNHLYNLCKEISSDDDQTKATKAPTKRTKEQSFNLFLDQFLKDLGNYEMRQDLDRFQVGIDAYLSFRKKMLAEFDIRHRENYLRAINNYQGKLNRVDLLLAHDRGFIWHQVQAEHHSVEANNWKEKVQALGYSHRTVTNYINFFNLCELYPRILTSSAYFSEWSTFLSRFKEELKKNTTLSTRCAEQLMME